MKETRLFHHILSASAERRPDSAALSSAGVSWTYEEVQLEALRFSAALKVLGLRRFGRVAVYLDKKLETVTSMFGACAAGGIFVPVNPILKPHQVAHILQDCGVTVLVTSRARLATLSGMLGQCSSIRHVVLADASSEEVESEPTDGPPVHSFAELTDLPPSGESSTIDSDVAAILYTSGSTGHPKGVVLSHRNLVVGAGSVAQYLKNDEEDVLLAALPLSFDAGLSQITTAFRVGARVVLHNYLLAKDVVKTVAEEGVTGITAVPPMWAQLAELPWPDAAVEPVRYWANTGGRMPRSVLERLRGRLPKADVYLMYGLTEAFRATYLPPAMVDDRPDSIGRAIPNAEVMVLREDGTPCTPGETGELVQRGALVALGYWNDPERTAERFRPLPAESSARPPGVVTEELAVFSGDLVRADDDGFLYFVSRKDEMLKTSGYRVSPTEVEEVLHSSGVIAECAAFGIPHATMGQLIGVVVKPRSIDNFDTEHLFAHCRQMMPKYMVPSRIEIVEDDLPRNQNGKIDRKAISLRYAATSGESG